MSDTCAGACCSVFPLHASHPIFRKEKMTGELAFIADMVIPLTRRQALRRSRRLGYPDPPKYPKGYQMFTCRHWDEKTRLCTVYEKRPQMCRQYPYVDHKCERGCGYTLSKADKKQIKGLPIGKQDTPWVWDAEAKGWRPQSTSTHVWNARRRLMENRPKVEA